MVQVSTAYFVSSRVRARSYTTSEPVMRGCTISRWPLDSRNTACLARRITSSIVLPLSVRNRRGLDTRRSTSVLVSFARAIRYPSSRGASSRTIVSTSGSSGTAPPDLPPPDVPPIRLALECDQLARGGAAPCRLGHRVTQPRHAQHTAAVHAQRAVRVAIRPGVEHQRSGLHVA